MYRPVRGINPALANVAQIRYNPTSGVPALWISNVRQNAQAGQRIQGREAEGSMADPMLLGNNINEIQTE